MKKLSFHLFLGFLTLTASASATTFNFAFSLPLFNQNTTDTGSGMITANYISDGKYLVTGITGTTSAWGAITGLVAPGGYPDAPASNNNLLYYPSSPCLDGDGISFYVQGAGDSGTSQVNIYYYYDYITLEAYHEIFSFYDGSFSITPAASAVPEPSSSALVLLSFAAAGVALLDWRRVPRLHAMANGPAE